MNPPQAPPVIATGPIITYELTQGDLFAVNLTVLLRRPWLLGFTLALLLFHAGVTLLSELRSGPLPNALLQTFLAEMVMFIVLVILLTALAFVTSFFGKHQGIVGEHTIAITEGGLVEKTAFNESLHTWAGICRVVYRFGYWYIYVSEYNSFPIPARSLPRDQMNSFIAELRARANAATP